MKGVLHMTKYLIINADDFGLSKSVNKGIIESFRNGTVSSTTLMTNMPGFEDAVRLANEHPDLGVGLHFNLSYGRPLSRPDDVPSLVKEDGRFVYHPDSDHIPWTAADVERELEAQWLKFVSTGRKPTHIDSHHLVHALGPAYPIVAEFCHKQGVPLRLTQPTPVGSTPHPLTTKELVVDEYFMGDGKERMLDHISHLEEGVTEILCHPGYVDEDVLAISPWTDVREVELAVFTDKTVAQAIRDAGVVRTHFGEIGSLIQS